MYCGFNTCIYILYRYYSRKQQRQTNQIADAIQENTELKLKVNELNDQIAQMQEEIDSLHAELEAMPTIEPILPSGSPAPSVSPTSPISPRIGVQ